MRKDVRTVLKGLRNLADPPSSFEIVWSKHIKVKWDMNNDLGKRVTLKTTLGATPSSAHWFKEHKRVIHKNFRNSIYPKESTMSEDLHDLACDRIFMKKSVTKS